MSAAGRERRGLRLRTRWTIGVRLSDLDSMTTLVALTLAGWANADGLGARPSFLSVAKGCRLTRRSVVTHIKKLEEAGWIRRRSGRGIPNRYSLLIPTEMELKIEAQLGEGSREPDSLPGGELGNLSASSRESDHTKWGTPVPPSLSEPDKEPPTQVDLAPPWVALGMTVYEWNQRGQPQPETEERSEETKPGPIEAVVVDHEREGVAS
jgi:DNA-binding MarR family transcriptional regulator